jgi:hypothetical protein
MMACIGRGGEGTRIRTRTTGLGLVGLGWAREAGREEGTISRVGSSVGAAPISINNLTGENSDSLSLNTVNIDVAMGRA